MSRLPGGALLIVLGLMLLWLAITGKLDRFATAWDYVRGNSSAIGSTASSATPGGVGVAQLVEPASWHVGQMVAALSPSIVMAGVGA